MLDSVVSTDPWLLIGLAAMASAGWVLERRRRWRLEAVNDSILWAGVQPPSSSIITSTGEFEPTLPPDASAAAPAPPPAAPVGTHTISRREAALFDLQQLHAKLRRRRARGDLLAGVSLLQQHVADFRYTSPWVFLELRELLSQLDREQEWEAARAIFQERFNQRAPVWQSPSTADVQLADDANISRELIAQWPYRETRMVILNWMLGEPGSRQQGYAPPVLALGVSRDLLFLDRLLDGVMLERPPTTDFMLLPLAADAQYGDDGRDRFLR